VTVPPVPIADSATPASMCAVRRLVDGFGRVHTNLRISVTDRCNVRCLYCMPDEEVSFRPRHEILRYEEIERVAAVAAALGITRIRLTGGEPLVRRDLPSLVDRLTKNPGINEVALTTNGLLLAQHAVALCQAGLSRLNISLDTLREETFFQLTRRTGLRDVLAGIDAAQAAGFTAIRLNAVPLRGINEADVVPLAKFALDRRLELRFIEQMPFAANGNLQRDRLMENAEVRALLTARFGELTPVPNQRLSQPAQDFCYGDGGRVGFISSVTHPFCENCNRLRLTADGKLRNCLFSNHEWDVRRPLRENAGDEEIADVLVKCVQAKNPIHGHDSQGFNLANRAMHQIGG
jgi:cyclic pyranopterin phosphate synthase